MELSHSSIRSCWCSIVPTVFGHSMVGMFFLSSVENRCRQSKTCNGEWADESVSTTGPVCRANRWVSLTLTDFEDSFGGIVFWNTCAGFISVEFSGNDVTGASSFLVISPHFGAWFKPILHTPVSLQMKIDIGDLIIIPRCQMLACSIRIFITFLWWGTGTICQILTSYNRQAHACSDRNSLHL